jgi:hypothetical protein
MQHITGLVAVMSVWFKAVADWCRDNEGLGGWVGAIGAVIAIFVTWGLARAEYQRTKRESVAQKLRQLSMLHATIYVGDGIIMSCAENVIKNDSAVVEYWYNESKNGTKVRLLEELDKLPITDWPNPMIVLSFRPYWRSASRFLESLGSAQLTRDERVELVDDYKKNRANLEESFAAIEGYIKSAGFF